ncbi:guanylate kinase [Streptomyces sp. MP131-18]|uniref:guanylate kinase n=1 Tax=Streptomyces sp. MP131-18 TaxID=1857892 RepID=UPI0009A1A528|nr:guanylate kinase [Streptomyces sp. MP131-18]ONK16057.1 Guanylate kinase [Streptomyces sp. MP131-18]
MPESLPEAQAETIPAPQPENSRPLVTRPAGTLLVLSGPSGTGKTSLSRAMVEKDPTLATTRSVTTRKPRGPGEEHYDYVSREVFLKMVGNGDFVQWIHPSFDEYYGTLRAPVEKALSEGQDLVFDYCTEGYLNLRRFYPEQVVGVFVMAPSVEAMAIRLKGRGSESPEELVLRHHMAAKDFAFVDQHDYHVINDDFDAALQTLLAIRRAEQARMARQRAVLDVYAQHAEPTLLRYY